MLVILFVMCQMIVFVLHDARRQTLIDHSFNVTRVSHDFFRFLKNISNDRVFFLINSVKISFFSLLSECLLIRALSI